MPALPSYIPAKDTNLSNWLVNFSIVFKLACLGGRVPMKQAVSKYGLTLAKFVDNLNSGVRPVHSGCVRGLAWANASRHVERSIPDGRQFM